MLFVTLSGVQHTRAVRAEAQHFGHTLLSRSRSGSAAPVLPRKARSGPNPAGRRPLPATPGTAALCPAKPARERRSPKAPHGHSETGAPQGNSGHTRGAQVCRSEYTALPRPGAPEQHKCTAGVTDECTSNTSWCNMRSYPNAFNEIIATKRLE